VLVMLGQWWSKLATDMLDTLQRWRSGHCESCGTSDPRAHEVPAPHSVRVSSGFASLLCSLWRVFQDCVTPSDTACLVCVPHGQASLQVPSFGNATAHAHPDHAESVRCRRSETHAPASGRGPLVCHKMYIKYNSDIVVLLIKFMAVQQINSSVRHHHCELPCLLSCLVVSSLCCLCAPQSVRAPPVTAVPCACVLCGAACAAGRRIVAVAVE